MRRKINRIGEEGINNFGSKMIISRYNGALDIDIYISLSTTGRLKIKNINILKMEKLTALMNLEFMVKDI